MAPRRLAPFVLLETTQVLTAVASGMSYIVVPWLLLDLTGSALLAGLVTAAKGVIAFVVFPIAGTFVDRVGRRRVAIIADALAAITAMMLPVLSLVWGPTVALIATVTILGAAFEPPGFTARKSLIANTAQSGNLTLERANGIHESIRGLGWIGGPAIGSLAVAIVGPENSFWVIGTGFALSMIVTCFIRITHSVDGESDLDESPDGFFRETIDGFRALGRDRALLLLIIFWVILDIVYIPSEEIVLPYYFTQQNDPVGLGIVISSMVLGGTVGALLFEFLLRRMSIPTMIRWCVLVCCTVLLAMAFFPPVWLFALIGFSIGITWGPMNPLLGYLVQRRFPSSIQGRVFGVQLALFSVAPPLALPIVGALVERFGPQPVYLVQMVATFILAIAVVFMPILKDLEQDKPGLHLGDLTKPRSRPTRVGTSSSDSAS